MNYERYFTRLIQKSNEVSYEFPGNHHFTHRENNYYADALSYNGVRFNYVISSERSRAYGEDFVGLIVELYIHRQGHVDSYFEQLKQSKEEIEDEIGDEDIIWQPREETYSQNVSRVYARKAVDIDDESRWDEYIDWQVNTMVKFLKVFPKYIDNLQDIGGGVIEPNPLPHTAVNKVKNIILYGSPGVGKTHNTKKLISLIERRVSEKEIFETIQNNELNNGTDANQIVGNISSRVKFITFHQSFGYEDFIEGFRPNEDGNIELQDGVFKQICKDASNNSEENYYLVIDEINRGNISKIFGELITLIEEDKRDTYEVTLPYSKEKFSVPSNLYIIATMNSTDKSIALIDIALRRRFTFLKMKPNGDLVSGIAKDIFVRLNEKLGEEYQIGHSYFMGLDNQNDLDFVLEYKIKPLLEEYFYGDTDGLNKILKILDTP